MNHTRTHIHSVQCELYYTCCVVKWLKCAERLILSAEWLSSRSCPIWPVRRHHLTQSSYRFVIFLLLHCFFCCFHFDCCEQTLQSCCVKAASQGQQWHLANNRTLTNLIAFANLISFRINVSANIFSCLMATRIYTHMHIHIHMYIHTHIFIYN